MFQNQHHNRYEIFYVRAHTSAGGGDSIASKRGERPIGFLENPLAIVHDPGPDYPSR